jgi:hypothetical protein
MSSQAKAQSNTEAAEAPQAEAAPRYRLLPIVGAIVKDMLTAWPIFGDIYPSRVMAPPAAGIDDRGREGTIVQLLVQRTNLKGETFTKVQKVLEQYVFQRPEGLKGELIDTGSLAEVLAAHAERFGDFMSEQRSSNTVASE